MTNQSPCTRSKELSRNAIIAFRETIYAHYADHKRILPWRETDDPYSIWVSEIMLQQTQVERVAKKYGHFLEKFPDFKALSDAPLRDVLTSWQGLGYNRRAIALHRTAHRIVAEFNAVLPDSVEILLTLPGIGKGTAGALTAFAFQRPAVFIETNIRRVFIHCFFPNEDKVKDCEILPFVEQTLDKNRVRDWYYALMDYGSMLKTLEHNPNRRSAHHHVQSRFHGSDRQIRGLILKILVEHPVLKEDCLVRLVDKDEARTKRILNSLIEEGFMEKNGDMVRIVP